MIYFNTYGEAVQYALQTKIDEGFVFDNSEMLIALGVNSVKPSEGKTTSLHLPIVNSELYLHIQVFNGGYEYVDCYGLKIYQNCYELNFYTS